MSGNQKKQQQQTINLQDTFLSEVQKNQHDITIFLVNGYQYQGVVKNFDNFTVLLLKDGIDHLLYKHAITTLIPSKPTDMDLSNPQNKNKQQNINLQDAFLNEVRKKRIQITIYLSNGYQLKGIVKNFDNFTILLMKDGKEYLLYKHAITTLIPNKPLEMEI